MSKIQPFHLAIPVDDLEAARTFYRDTLELQEGRSDEHWVDLDFFGHQLVIHYKEKETASKKATNPVDGKAVPIPHFGVVLTWEDFHIFSEKLQQMKLTKRMKTAQCIKPTFCTPCPLPNRKFKSHNLYFL